MSKRYPGGPYGLSIVLFALAAVAMLLQWHFTWDMLVAEAAEQGNQAPHFYTIWSTYWANVWENLQSEWWQLFTFVVLTSFLVHKGSHESKDSDEHQAAMLQDALQHLKRLEEKLDALSGHAADPPA
jgi:hypothetical protein